MLDAVMEVKARLMDRATHQLFRVLGRYCPCRRIAIDIDIREVGSQILFLTLKFRQKVRDFFYNAKGLFYINGRNEIYWNTLLILVVDCVVESGERHGV